MAETIAVDLQPFSIVENKGFRSLLNTLDPKYKLPTRTTFSRSIYSKMFENEQRKFVVDIQKANISLLAVTSDIWSSRNQDSFIDLTEHYIDDNLQMHSYLLNSHYFLERHTYGNILAKIEYVLDTYQIEITKTKLVIVTETPAIL